MITCVLSAADLQYYVLDYLLQDYDLKMNLNIRKMYQRLFFPMTIDFTLFKS